MPIIIIIIIIIIVIITEKAEVKREALGGGRYMLEILPNTDWSQELVRPALNLILRRLDRLFTKISKKTALRVRMRNAVMVCHGFSHTAVVGLVYFWVFCSLACIMSFL